MEIPIIALRFTRALISPYNSIIATNFTEEDTQTREEFEAMEMLREFLATEL